MNHEDPTQIWAYRIDKAGPDIDPERARMSNGQGPFDVQWTAQHVANHLVERNRIEHSYYQGPRTVTVWQVADLDDATRWPTNREPAPMDAEIFEFPAVDNLDDARHDRQALRMLHDMDRCAHGRRAIDPCGACPGGQSTGNLYARPGTRIGTDRYGQGYFVPADREDRDDPRAWRVAPTDPAVADDPVTSALYRERAHLVAALCKKSPDAIMVPDPENPGWGIVYIEMAHAGQLSWHIAPEDIALFRGVVQWRETWRWDGHTTDEKYARIRARNLHGPGYALAGNDAERLAVGFRLDTDPQPTGTHWASWDLTAGQDQVKEAAE